MIYSDFNVVTKDNINYTVDMIRIKTEIEYSKFSYIEFVLKSCYSSIIKKYYNSFSITDFKYNYNLEVCEGSSYWFGYMHNSQQAKMGSVSNPNTKFNLTVEFNPNKVKIDGFLKFLISFVGLNWTIKSFDMAMDLKLNILDLCGFDKKRYKDIRIFNSGYDNMTIYIGRSQNHIKIYNKKIESNLDYELTRVEVSSKCDVDLSKFDMYKYNINLPEIYTNDYMFSFSDYKDKTTLAVLFAVHSGYPISNLSRDYKEKIKKMLSGGYKVNLDISMCNFVLHKCVFNIFNF